MTRTAMVFFALSLLSASAAFAGELDPAPVAPNAIIVRTDGNGAHEVFNADGIQMVKDDASASAAITSYVKPENKLGDALPQSELDRTSSDGAWYYRYDSRFHGYSYGFRTPGYFYNYAPFYNYFYSGWNYSYYYPYGYSPYYWPY